MLAIERGADGGDDVRSCHKPAVCGRRRRFPVVAAVQQHHLGRVPRRDSLPDTLRTADIPDKRFRMALASLPTNLENTSNMGITVEQWITSRTKEGQMEVKREPMP